METTAAAEGPRTPLWEDFVDVFYAPAAVFDRRRDGRYALALTVLTLAMTILFFASQATLAPVMEAELARAVQGQEIPPEQMEMIRRMSGIFGTIGFMIVFPIGVMLTGAALWLVAKVFGATGTLATAVMVGTYAHAPRLLQQLLIVVQGMVLEPVRSLNDVSLSPARFFDPETTSAVILSLLGRLDPFVLWSTVLLGLGAHVVWGLDRPRAFAAAGIVWLLAAAPAVLQAL